MNKKKIAFLAAGLVLGAPLWVSAAGLIPCGGDKADPCDFNKLMSMANSIIHFLMYDVMIPLAALGFMFTGAKLIINQNKEAEWSQAKERFGYLGWGIFIIVGAFVVIKFILSQFLSAGFSVDFLLN